MPQTGDSSYTPPKVSGYLAPDLATFGAPNAPTPTGPAGRPKFSSKVVQNTDEGQIIQWRIVIDDLRGGTNITEGPYEEVYNRYAMTTLDTALDGRYYQTLCLQQLATTDAPADAEATVVGVHSVNVLDRLWVAAGLTANKALARETSASNPALQLVTYTATSFISGLAAVVIGGATAAQRLAVCRNGTGDNVQIISDTSATVAGTMHNDTARCWGIIQSPTISTTYNEPLMIYSSGALRFLSKTAAITDAPTATLTNVPNGGYALGLVRLAGGPMRAAWVWPFADTTGGMMTSANLTGRVVLTDLETGTTAQEVNFGHGIRLATVMNGNAIVAATRSNVFYYDGRSQPRNLRLLENRLMTSSATLAQELTIFDIRADGNEIWVRYGSGLLAWLDVYDITTGVWHTVALVPTITAVNNSWAGKPAVSTNTRFAHFNPLYDDGGIFQVPFRIYMPEYGRNPYTLRLTTGGLGGAEYRASGSIRLPAYSLPGLEGHPKTVSRIIFGGDVDAGGTAATAAQVTVKIYPPGSFEDTGLHTIANANGINAVFGTGTRSRAQYFDNDSQEVFDKLVVGINVERTTADTHYTPNALPIIIEGYCYVRSAVPPAGWVY